MTPCINLVDNFLHPIRICKARTSRWKPATLSNPLASRWVGTAAVASSPMPPPHQPPGPTASAIPTGPGGIAAATRLLEAIPRARTVRELREVLREAQDQGCFTTAHSVAIIMQLGTLASMALAFPTPGEAESARQLGAQLLRRLQDQHPSLPPTLRAYTDRAAQLLGIALERKSQQQQQLDGGSSSSGPAAGTSRIKGEAEEPMELGTSKTQSAASLQHQMMQQPSGRRPYGRVALPERNAGKGQAAQEQQQPKQDAPQVPRQQKQEHQEGRRQPQTVSQAATSISSFKGYRSPLSADDSDRQPSPQSRGGKAAPRAPNSAIEVSPAAPSTTSVSAPVDPCAAVSPATGALAAPSLAMASQREQQTAAAPSPQSTAAAATALTFQEALQVAWSACESPDSSTQVQASSPSLGPAAQSAVEAALQSRPPTQMSIGDIVEVVLMLAALRLMPRYDWLCDAQDRLRHEMAAAGVQAADEMAGLPADLRQVYEATEDLMHMCWEADRGRQRSDGAQEPATVAITTVAQEVGSAKGEHHEQQQQRRHREADGADAELVTSLTSNDGTLRNQAARATAPKASGDSHSSSRGSSNSGGMSRRTADEIKVVGSDRAMATTLTSSGGGGSTGDGSGDDNNGGDNSVSTGTDRLDAEGAVHDSDVINRFASLGPPSAALHSPVQPVSSAPLGVSMQLEETKQQRLQQAVAHLGGAGPPPAVIAPTSVFGVRDAEEQENQSLIDDDNDIDGSGIEDDACDPMISLERLRALLQQVKGATAAGSVVMGAPRGHDGGVCSAGSSPYSVTAAANTAVEDLTAMMTETVRKMAVEGQSVSIAGAAVAINGVGTSLVLTAEQLRSLVVAARGAQPAGLPRQLLSAAAKLLVAMRGGVTCRYVAPVLAACAEASYTLPSYLLAQLAVLVFPTQSPTGLRDTQSSSPAGEAAKKKHHQKHQLQLQSTAVRAPSAASLVRDLHECSVALDRLGYRLNSRQFGDWVDAVASHPSALRPAQLVQLMAACTERGYMVRPSEVTGTMIAAATQPVARLRQLSGSEAVAIVIFAAKQGLQLGDDSDFSNSSSTSERCATATSALLQHLVPCLRELTLEEKVALLPSLCAVGALDGDAVSTTSLLADHSAVLLPHAEELKVDQVLPLLRSYKQLGYQPPVLLLLGISLALESQLATAPLLPLLQALHLLLCGRMGFRTNEGLAAAIQDSLLPRLMLAATKALPSPLQQELLQQRQQQGDQHLEGLTMRQRLVVLEVLAAARVRPHPARMAALLEVELAGGEGLMATLSGDALVALLWSCVVFRALPSWRFIGEWLEAFAAAIDAVGSGGGSGSSDGFQVSPDALARAGWCMAQMGVQPEAAWQKAYQTALLLVLPKLDAEALSLVAHSALLLRCRPSDEWLEALLRAGLGRMEELDGPSAARLLHFAAAGNVALSKDWMQSFFLNTLGLVTTPLAQNPIRLHSLHAAATPDQLTLMLRALAQLGFRPPEPWLAAALVRLRSEAAALSPACFPVALMSLARLCPDEVSELGSGGIVDELMRSAYKRRGEFTALELHWLLEALERYPQYELPAAAAANLLAELQRRVGTEEAVEAEGSGDVAMALGDAVSASWLEWGAAVALNTA